MPRLCHAAPDRPRRSDAPTGGRSAADDARARPPARRPGRSRAARPRTASDAITRGRPRGLQRRSPSARCAASATSACSRAVRGAVGVALAGEQLDASSPSKNTSVASSRWPPVMTTSLGPERVQRPRERLDRRLGRPSARAREDPRLGRFGVITVASGSSSLDDRRARLVVEQHRAGLGDHHRVDHDRHAVASSASASRTARTVSAVPSMPIFTASTPMSSATVRDLLDDELARHRVDAGHADGALGRQRRDRGHPVHAAARERLQVGLDAGAAAGVRAGDREHGRYGSGHRGQVRRSTATGPSRTSHWPRCSVRLWPMAPPRADDLLADYPVSDGRLRRGVRLRRRAPPVRARRRSRRSLRAAPPSCREQVSRSLKRAGVRFSSIEGDLEFYVDPVPRVITAADWDAGQARPRPARARAQRVRRRRLRRPADRRRGRRPAAR